MWKTLKNFIFKENYHAREIEKSRENAFPQVINKDVDNVTKKALAHYCEICNRGFKTPGAKSAHTRLKHLKDGN